jgi:hypothetical protein
MTAGNNWRAHGNGQEVNNVGPPGHMPEVPENGNNGTNGQLEQGNMSIDNKNKECEWLLAVGHVDTVKLNTINELL